jgi:hypothetical protein
LDIGDFSSWNGFQNAGGEISVHIYGLTVLAKALFLPVKKQMLTVKRTMMHLQMRNKGTSSLRGFNGK